MTSDGGLRALIVCPRDRTKLEWASDALCANGHRYPIVHGVPILFGDRDPTGFSSRTNDRIQHGEFEVEVTAASSGQVDRVVQDAILGTNGNLYRHLEGRLPRYPIPEIRLPPETAACCSTSEAVGAGGALRRRAPAIGRSSSIHSWSWYWRRCASRISSMSTSRRSAATPPRCRSPTTRSTSGSRTR